MHENISEIFKPVCLAQTTMPSSWPASAWFSTLYSCHIINGYNNSMNECMPTIIAHWIWEFDDELLLHVQGLRTTPFVRVYLAFCKTRKSRESRICCQSNKMPIKRKWDHLVSKYMKDSSMRTDRNVPDIEIHSLPGINNGIITVFWHWLSWRLIPVLSSIYIFPHSLQKAVKIHGHSIIIFIIGNTDGRFRRLLIRAKWLISSNSKLFDLLLFTPYLQSTL